MARLRIGTVEAEIDAVAFDKDGTLIDFAAMWRVRLRAWLDAVLARVPGVDPAERQRLADVLYQSLGYDAAQGRVVPDSPLAVASTSQLEAGIKVVLYQQSIPWDAAETAVHGAWSQLTHTVTADQVRPIGPVRETLARLQAAGVQTAVITSDDRAITEQVLPLLDVVDLVAEVVCGDDDRPDKPAPDGLLYIAERLGVRPERMMMVGDTVSDMVCGRAAQVGVCAAVRGGAGRGKRLAAVADVIIDHIGQIELIA